MTVQGKQVSWGLVLSGGAACGLANIGVLEVLEAEGLRPDAIAGSSMGAIVAGLFALGHSTTEMRQVAGDLKPLSVLDFNRLPFKGGLHGGLLTQRLEEHLAPILGEACIGDCEIPLICVAGRVRRPIHWERMLRPGFTTHLLDCVELHVFGPDIRLIDALRASSAIPVLFNPARVGAEEFIDLVHFGAIPAKTLRAYLQPDTVIATDTMPKWEQFEAWMPAAVKEFMIAGWEQTAESLAACDLVLRPELPATAFRFDLSHRFADSGRAAANARLAEIRQLVHAP